MATTVTNDSYSTPLATDLIVGQDLDFIQSGSQAIVGVSGWAGTFVAGAPETFNEQGTSASVSVSGFFSSLTNGYIVGGAVPDRAEVSVFGNAGSLSATPSLFPLSVSTNGRYLEDANGDAFLIHGDSPWSLEVQCTTAEVDRYLNDTESKGFNALLFMAFDHLFSSQTPAWQNANGDQPFGTINGAGTVVDFTDPTEAYWSHVDYIVDSCAQRNIVCIINPAFLGFNGGNEGWNSAVLNASAAELQGYGVFLANRYTQGNVIWCMAGDYLPPDPAKQWNIVTGIRSVRTTDIITAHTTRSIGEAYLDYNGFVGFNLNNIYSDSVEYDLAAAAYSRPGPIPFFLIEGRYENEAGDAGIWRRQPYASILSGACGHFFGNNPLWGFGEPNFSGGLGVQDALDNHLGDPVRTDMQYVKQLFDNYQWQLLEPKTDTSFVTTPLGSGGTRSIPALASDGTFAMIYRHDNGSETVDMTNFTVSSVRVREFNPTDGTYTDYAGTPFPNTGTQVFIWNSTILVFDEEPTSAFANDKNQANAYDSAWQSGWVAQSKATLGSASGHVDGMFIMLGDSLSRSPWIGDWAINGAGKTAEDIAICTWMHAGDTPRVATKAETATSAELANVVDGYYLQAPVYTTPPQGGYHCNNRSYTVGDGLGAWSYLDAGSMPSITDPVLARDALVTCSLYSENDLNLTTILSALQKPQFALMTFKSPGPGGDPTSLPSGYVEMCDALEAAGVVPIIQTETYRRVYRDPPDDPTPWTVDWMDAIDTQNNVRRAFAQSRNLPLIDLQAEMEARRPILDRSDDGLRIAWQNKYLDSSGVHLTGSGSGGYSSSDDPYADGGDPVTHATGAMMTYTGYGLKGWLFAQKMKQLKALVVDALGPLNLPLMPDFSPFTYAGGFRLPNNKQTVGGIDFGYVSNKGTIEVAADRTKMYVGAKPWGSGGSTMGWAQIDIPALNPATPFTNMPVATSVQGLVNIPNGANRVPLTGNSTEPDRMMHCYEYQGMLLGTCQDSYEGDSGTDKMLWRVEDATDLPNSAIGGYYSASGYRVHARECASGWIVEVPDEWKALFGYNHLAGASHAFQRGASYDSGGPTLYGVDLDQLTVTTPGTIVFDEFWTFPNATQDSLFMNQYSNLIGINGWDGAVGYPRTFRPAEYHDVNYNMYLRNDPSEKGDVHWPEQGDVIGNDLFTVYCRVGIGFIVPNTRTYACFGKACGFVGGMGYDVVNDEGVKQDGPMPYVNQDRYNYLWLFDMADAIDAKNGVKTIGDILPYWHGEIELPYEYQPSTGGEDGGHIFGGTWDPDNLRLYLAIRSYDSNKPLILAYDYTG